jgi:hypothetical protein
MEDGIERMMTPESYNIHFLNENKNKNENKIKKIVEKDLTVEKDLKKDLNVVKELKSTNPQ